jgi:hypothetical protein
MRKRALRALSGLFSERDLPGGGVKAHGGRCAFGTDETGGSLRSLAGAETAAAGPVVDRVSLDFQLNRGRYLLRFVCGMR